MGQETKEKSRDDLIVENMPLVYFCLNKYYPSFRNDEDLVQCGMIGLIEAVDNRDNAKHKFSTYAMSIIRNHMAKELKRRVEEPKTVSLDQMMERRDDLW